MWIILRAFISGRIWQIALVLVTMISLATIYYNIRESGVEKQKKVVEKQIKRNVRAANDVESKNKKLGDSDIAKRLQQWAITCE